MIEHGLPACQGFTFGGGFGGLSQAGLVGSSSRVSVLTASSTLPMASAHGQQGFGGLLGFLVGGGWFQRFDGAQQGFRLIAQTLLLVATKRLSLFRRGDGGVCLFHEDKHGTGIRSGD